MKIYVKMKPERYMRIDKIEAFTCEVVHTSIMCAPC